MDNAVITENKLTVENWSPSVRLRFVERGLMMPQKVLQQLHTSNLGNRKWIDVPTEKEEQYVPNNFRRNR